MEFKIPYYISSNGDGSASLVPMPSEEEAEAAPEAEEEWGESTAGTLVVKVDGNRLFYQDWQDVKGRYTKVWVEIKD